MRWWISGFHKMLGSSRVAAQLAASREGLGSMSEWVMSSRLKVNRLCLPPAFTLVSSSAYCSTLKIEAICSSETSVDFSRITRLYVPEVCHYIRRLFHNLVSKEKQGMRLGSGSWGMHTDFWGGSFTGIVNLEDWEAYGKTTLRRVLSWVGEDRRYHRGR
jgi:hypothetical protein